MSFDVNQLSVSNMLSSALTVTCGLLKWCTELNNSIKFKTWCFFDKMISTIFLFLSTLFLTCYLLKNFIALVVNKIIELYPYVEKVKHSQVGWIGGK